jgi:hypothetical protein
VQSRLPELWVWIILCPVLEAQPYNSCVTLATSNHQGRVGRDWIYDVNGHSAFQRFLERSMVSSECPEEDLVAARSSSSGISRGIHFQVNEIPKWT